MTRNTRNIEFILHNVITVDQNDQTVTITTKDEGTHFLEFKTIKEAGEFFTDGDFLNDPVHVVAFCLRAYGVIWNEAAQ